MRLFAVVALFLLLSCLLPPSASAKVWLAYVVAVEDGNAITVCHSPQLTGKRDVLRLYGIDAPTMRQPFGKEARDFLRRLMPRGKQIEVETVSRDKKGALLAMIKVDGQSLNYRLIEEGLAWVNRHRCRASFCRRWYIQEHQAVVDRRNIWSLNVSTPPWQWSR